MSISIKTILKTARHIESFNSEMWLATDDAKARSVRKFGAMDQIVGLEQLVIYSEIKDTERKKLLLESLHGTWSKILHWKH